MIEEKLVTPPIRSALMEAQGPEPNAKTPSREWWLYWRQAGERVNEHTGTLAEHADTLAQLDTAVEDLTEDLETLETAAVKGGGNLTNPGAIPKVSTAGTLTESALTDDAIVVRIRRTISGTVQPTLVIDSGIAAKGRVGRVNNVARLDLSNNIWYDGANFHLDDITQDGRRITLTGAGIFFQEAPAGADPAPVATRAAITSAGLQVTGDYDMTSVTGVYRVAGTQVVGTRGGALTATGGAVAAAPAAYSQAYEQTLANAINNLITRVNEIQARLQAHGLIA